MGFHDKWVSWISLCLESVQNSISVNGDMVCSGRGLRQGDPLSPYPFLICVEGLTTLLKRAESMGDLHGVKACSGGSIPYTPNVYCFAAATNEVEKIVHSKHL